VRFGFLLAQGFYIYLLNKILQKMPRLNKKIIKFNITKTLWTKTSFEAPEM